MEAAELAQFVVAGLRGEGDAGEFVGGRPFWQFGVGVKREAVIPGARQFVGEESLVCILRGECARHACGNEWIDQRQHACVHGFHGDCDKQCIQRDEPGEFLFSAGDHQQRCDHHGERRGDYADRREIEILQDVGRQFFEAQHGREDQRGPGKSEEGSEAGGGAARTLEDFLRGNGSEQSQRRHAGQDVAGQLRLRNAEKQNREERPAREVERGRGAPRFALNRLVRIAHARR